MENSIVATNGADIEKVVIMGDLASLSPQDRLGYYRAVCQSIGLNPLTKPFDYITLNGKLTLYARKDATDQLRNLRKISIVKLERERIEDIYTVTAYATTQDGREDSSIGAVSIANLKGDALANAIMKAETKSKRRVTLSICGLGMLDETELETIPQSSISKPTILDPDPAMELEPIHKEKPTSVYPVHVEPSAMDLEQAKKIQSGGKPLDAWDDKHLQDIIDYQTAQKEMGAKFNAVLLQAAGIILTHRLGQ